MNHHEKAMKSARKRQKKLSALQTAEFFANRKSRADFKAFDKIIKRRGGKPPPAGDEMPGSKSKPARHGRDK